LNRRNLSPDNLLLTGAPGVGKTTLIISLLPHLQEYRPVGFFTREIREQGIRAGFELVSLSGTSMVLAHTGIRSREQVGKYGVDIEGFDRYLETLRGDLVRGGLVVIDEIGKMEMVSVNFRGLASDVLDGTTPLLATIARGGDPFIERIKTRPDVRLVELTRTNRGGMTEELLPVIREMMENPGPGREMDP
jgi:nucleoside-triphosphatase